MTIPHLMNCEHKSEGWCLDCVRKLYESQPTHRCEPEKTESDGYGPAVDICYELKNGSLWVGNGEYGTRVNFCPFCGYKAKASTEPHDPQKPSSH